MRGCAAQSVLRESSRRRSSTGPAPVRDLVLTAASDLHCYVLRGLPAEESHLPTSILACSRLRCWNWRRWPGGCGCRRTACQPGGGTVGAGAGSRHLDLDSSVSVVQPAKRVRRLPACLSEADAAGRAEELLQRSHAFCLRGGEPS